MKDKVVYLHKKAGTDEVVYVGIGSPSRPFDFEGRSDFWKRVHAKYGIDVEVIHEGLSWEEACKIEIELIAHYGRRDLGTGCLVNLTDGGEGAVNTVRDEAYSRKLSASLMGHKVTKETREKLRKAKTGKKWTKKQRENAPCTKGENNGFYGRKHTKDVRSRLSQVRKGKKPTEKHKLNQAKGQAKHCDTVVLLIRSLYVPRSKKNGMVQLAERFSIPYSVVNSIINRKTYYWL